MSPATEQGYRLHKNQYNVYTKFTYTNKVNAHYPICIITHVHNGNMHYNDIEIVYIVSKMHCFYRVPEALEETKTVGGNRSLRPDRGWSF